jgi:uncharacterized iron-regulated membrane protein
MKRLNQNFLWLHRWTGIVFAIVFVVVGLSGSLLTFRWEIQQFANPDDLVIREAVGQKPDFRAVVAGVDAETPGARVRFLQMNPAKPTFPMRVIVEMPDESIRVRYANPASGKLVDRDINEGFWRMMRNLHIFLLLGLPGLLVVFVSGWILIACSLLGVWLWAPRLKKPRIALGVRWRANPKKKMLDLHNVTGIYVLIPMLLLGLSGATLILARLSPTELPQPTVAAETAAVDSQTTVRAGYAALSVALDTLDHHASEVSVQQVKFPTGDEPWFAFEVDDPARGYQTHFIDPSGTEVLLTLNERDLSLWDQLKAELGVAIHEGYILGDFGRWLVFVCGLTVTAGSVTGVWLWLVRRKQRQWTRSGARRACGPS